MIVLRSGRNFWISSSLSLAPILHNLFHFWGLRKGSEEVFAGAAGAGGVEVGGSLGGFGAAESRTTGVAGARSAAEATAGAADTLAIGAADILAIGAADVLAIGASAALVSIGPTGTATGAAEAAAGGDFTNCARTTSTPTVPAIVIASPTIGPIT